MLGPQKGLAVRRGQLNGLKERQATVGTVLGPCQDHLQAALVQVRDGTRPAAQVPGDPVDICQGRHRPLLPQLGVVEQRSHRVHGRGGLSRWALGHFAIDQGGLGQLPLCPQPIRFRQALPGFVIEGIRVGLPGEKSSCEESQQQDAQVDGAAQEGQRHPPEEVPTALLGVGHPIGREGQHRKEQEGQPQGGDVRFRLGIIIPLAQDGRPNPVDAKQRRGPLDRFQIGEASKRSPMATPQPGRSCER